VAGPSGIGGHPLHLCFFSGSRSCDSGRRGAVVSPADGKVIINEKLSQCDYYEGECVKISIFMTVFNVHVNRIVYDGTITDVNYHPGKFFSANLDKASRENEHNAF
jgi:phosphatidylserine decarboxylase